MNSKAALKCSRIVVQSDQTVAFMSGNFNVVHPGHLRLLKFAAEQADILVVAVGRPALITADHIKPGATVIDVGLNNLERAEDVARIFRNSPEKMAAFERKGSVLVGDVDPVAVAEKSSAYTPAPGGVGPLTIAMLMANTVDSAERRLGLC